MTSLVLTVDLMSSSSRGGNLRLLGRRLSLKRELALNYPHLRFVFVFVAKLLSAIQLVASSRKLSFAIRFVASSRNFLSRFDSLRPLENLLSRLESLRPLAFAIRNLTFSFAVRRCVLFFRDSMRSFRRSLFALPRLPFCDST